MRVKRASRSGVFLIELIIAILFFAVASVICVQLFVRSHLTSQHSQDVSAAVTLAQNCAEQFKAMDEGEKYERLETNFGVETLYFGDVNGDIEQLDTADADYILTARYSKDEYAVFRLDIEISRPQSLGNPPLFSLTVKDYVGNPPQR